ncbi:MAG: FAD-dependent oxidoreductase [Rhodospirillales bacterium]|nr:FAD-dependent oxidoreductase [Rhodospirillales bacterium]
MNGQAAEVVIVGAGIAGVAAAFHLAVRQGTRRVVIVESGDPLALTSDKSTECYRNWWPGPGDAMVAFMNRSIDLLERYERESHGRLRLNRRGYLFATAEPSRITTLHAFASEAQALGAGPLRVHDRPVSDGSYVRSPAHGLDGVPAGADLITDPALIRTEFPYLDSSVVAVLHARRCGWLSAQQLGMWMLEQARAQGVELVRGRVTGVDTRGGRVRSVAVERPGEAMTIATPTLVLSPGPHLAEVAGQLDVKLPVACECHMKVSFRDTEQAIPGDAPLLIWADPVQLPWSDEERAALAADARTRRLINILPAGVHGRPEGTPGNHWLLMLWSYDTDHVRPVFPIAIDAHLPEVALRGWSRMLPSLKRYFSRLPRMTLDGGYYTKTPENRPLVGPLSVTGAFVNAAYSGFGIMGACAGGELLAAHVSETPLPRYASAFLPARFDDPAYLDAFTDAGAAGQL